MAKSAILVLMVTFYLLSHPVLAQVNGVPGRPVGPGRAHMEPCWQQAGISKSAMRERAAIERETRAQVEAVCADRSLTPQARQQRIRELHQQAKERSEALISPQQQETLRACQKERAGNRLPVHGMHHGGGGGPCGEMVPSTGRGAPSGRPQTDEHPMEEDSPPQN